MKKSTVAKIIFILHLAVVGGMQGECVQDGMNLWRLAECIACSVGAQYEIKQTNYLNTITASGHYKLCENIVDGGLGVLVIDASDVILDLGGYTIDGINGISIKSNRNNVVIKNGTITNSLVAFFVTGNNQNILIEDIVIDTIINISSLGRAFTSEFGQLNGLLVRNVTVYNGSPINFFINDSFFGPNKNIFFDNVTCIDFNPSYTSAPSPVGVIYLNNCDNVVLKDVMLTDQFTDINGIWLNTCTNIQVDGVTITSSLAAPPSARTAYLVDTCVVGLHKNISINGGANSVFATGISNPGSTFTMFDTCLVEFVSGTGIILDDENSIFNSQVRFAGVNGFEIHAGNVVKNCKAIDNVLRGYLVNQAGSLFEDCYATGSNIGFANLSVAPNCEFVRCIANANNTGFDLNGQNTELLLCIANNNTTNGARISNGGGSTVSNCVISESIFNENGTQGVLVQSIFAEADFVAGNPVPGTWNIGQFPPTLGNTSGHGIKLTNNIALRNGGRGFAMFGDVFDKAVPVNSVAFTTEIFPPIGVVNTIQGAIFNDPKPIPNTSLGGLTGVVGRYANTVGGNLINDK